MCRVAALTAHVAMRGSGKLPTRLAAHAAGRGGAGRRVRPNFAADYFPAATAAAVHPLAAEAAGAGGGRASRGPQTARGTARARAGLAARSLRHRRSQCRSCGGQQQGQGFRGHCVGGRRRQGRGSSARSGRGLGPAQGAGAAGSPSPNPARPRPPLSAEQRRARALVASVLPFDAVTFRGRGRHAGRAGLEVLEALRQLPAAGAAAGGAGPPRPPPNPKLNLPPWR